MKRVRIVVAAAAACALPGCWLGQEDDCAHTYYGGGRAMVTLVAGPGETETSWTVPGLDKVHLDRLQASGDHSSEAADRSNIYTVLVSTKAGGVVSAFARREARDAWVAAFVPVDEVPGLDCLSEPLAGFIVRGQLTPSALPSVSNEILFVGDGVDDVVMGCSASEEDEIGEATMDFHDETSGVMTLLGPLGPPNPSCVETMVDVTLDWSLDPKVDRLDESGVCDDWQF